VGWKAWRTCRRMLLQASMEAQLRLHEIFQQLAHDAVHLQLEGMTPPLMLLHVSKALKVFSHAQQIKPKCSPNRCCDQGNGSSNDPHGSACRLVVQKKV